MKPIAALLVFFVGLGIFARKYHGWVRLLLIACIGVLVLYETFH